MKKNLLFISLISFLSFSINAQIIHVPADHSSIQAGINAATDGDTVLVAEGTYFENIKFMGKAITVASEFVMDMDTTHIANTIIDGSQPEDPDSAAVVMFVNGEDTTSILHGFTITGGKGVYHNTYQAMAGGGIFTWNAGCKIIANNITGNVINYDNMVFGAGIYCGKSEGYSTVWAVIENNHFK